jgi:hypothetical protein
LDEEEGVTIANQPAISYSVPSKHLTAFGDPPPIRVFTTKVKTVVKG